MYYLGKQFRIMTRQDNDVCNNEKIESGEESSL